MFLCIGFSDWLNAASAPLFSRPFAVVKDLKWKMKRDRNAELEDKQPLLDGKGSEAETSVTPYATAGFFSLATISWLNPLLAEGYRKHLELKDLQLLAPESRATKAYGDFKESWNWLKIRNPNRARTLIHALMRSLWKKVSGMQPSQWSTFWQHMSALISSMTS